MSLSRSNSVFMDLFLLYVSCSISIRVLGFLAMLIVPFTFLKDYNLAISFFYSLAGFYFLNLLTNFIISIVGSIQIHKLYIILLTLGLLLFICCDIFVGLANIHLNPTFNKIAWIFYLPCQYLIAISIRREKYLNILKFNSYKHFIFCTIHKKSNR